MKKILVFASAILVSTALSAQNPAVKSAPKSEKPTTSPAVKPAIPLKNQPVKVETVRPISPTEIQVTPSKSAEPQKQSPKNPSNSDYKKRSKKDANKNLGTVKKGTYQTAPEPKKSN